MKVIIVISGFTQKRYQHTGSKCLWRELRMLRDLSTKDTVVHLKEWDSDWEEYSKFIISLAPEEVLVCCYSWGGGFGMPELCKRLLVPVTCVMCDPVYRSKTFWGRWMAFIDRKIPVPSNVTVVNHLVQEAKWYQLDGDPLKGGKSLCETEVLDYTHTEMDDSIEYHTAAVLAARKYIKG